MRQAEIKRETKETSIKISLQLDGEGNSDIASGIGFFDHMLTLFTKHGFFNLSVDCQGDLVIDGHHSVEDIGICLGKAIKEALGDKQGIKRYGSSFLPMDETLVLVALDVSDRPYLVYDVPELTPIVGTFATELTEEFLRALSVQAGLTLHVKLIHGKNAHHIIEAIFKALGRALREAVVRDPQIQGVMSTKGLL